MRGSWRPNKDCNILTPTLMAITAFLSRSPGLLTRGPGGPASPGTCSHSSIFSPNDLNFLCTELYYCFTPTQFKPSTVKVISWHPRPDAPVIYTGAFLILTAWPGRRSIYICFSFCFCFSVLKRHGIFNTSAIPEVTWYKPLYNTMKVEIVVWERERWINREPLQFTPHWDRYFQSLASSCIFYGSLIQSRLTTSPDKCLDDVTCLLCWLLTLIARWGWKLLSLYIFRTHTHSSFWHSTYTIHIAFLLSIVNLKTQRHILFLKSIQTRLSKINITNEWNLNFLQNNPLIPVSFPLIKVPLKLLVWSSAITWLRMHWLYPLQCGTPPPPQKRHVLGRILNCICW